ncbi:MASE3 domain-containing protein [Methanolobus profundi]|uniref:Signal transduction histidine kinase n=1 Tax=Methanolobus profundi TaxID=487685 RepID=A0A1I4UT33_9EURY|nr:MASE3 domain-containing protein [Methanolobus profundi]SFM92112.1 Signal transduction histidine kinase [Methanolobus profundi]
MGETHSYNRYSETIFIFFILVCLYFVSLKSFLLFHSIVEIASVVVISAVFLITWNSRHYLKNSYLLFLGVSLLFVAGIDLIHVMSYKGMNIFADGGADLPTQLWIAARYLQAISFLIAPFMLGKVLNVHKIFSIYSVVTISILASIYHGYFPKCFIEGSGLTQFKIISEYVISLILLASFIILRQHKEEFDIKVYNLLSGAIILTILAELAFTFYIDVYGFSNLVGHYFKLLSFYLIYKAIVVTSLTRPYDLLYRELKMREYELVKKKEAQERLLETLGLVNQILRHDILNDLNIISLSVDNLKERMNERELDLSEKAVRHSLQIIREMKDMESLMYIRDMKTIDLRTLTMEIAQEFPIDVDVHGTCSVKADSGLHSVIGNIILNAMVHGKADKVDISMSSQDDHCEMRISDNGSGIPDKIKERVFEEGFKYGPSGHTGLGLYIVKQIVERYGEISLEDNVPSGATFVLKFYHNYPVNEEKEAK